MRGRGHIARYCPNKVKTKETNQEEGKLGETNIGGKKKGKANKDGFVEVQKKGATSAN